MNMDGCGYDTFSRNNFQGSYKDSQGGGGGGLEAKCKNPLPTEPLYTAFIAHLPSDTVLTDIDNMFRDLKVKCKEEALKSDGALFCDTYDKVDISRSIRDSPSDIVEIANLKRKAVRYAIEWAAEAKNLAEMERKLADDLEKDREKYKKVFPLLYRLLEDSLNKAKLLANNAKTNFLNRTLNIEKVIKEAAYAEKVVEEYNMLASGTK